MDDEPMATATAAEPVRESDARFVETKLHRAWRKERRFHHARGLCHFLLWALALILVDWLVDWLFLIPGYGRVLLLAINVAALAWVLYHYWWRHLRRYSAVRTALQVERRHPELQSLLVSFVQLGEGSDPGHASPSLIRALRRQALEVTRPLDFREIVSFGELKRIFALSSAIVLFFAAISVNWSEHLEVLARRMFDPASHARYPTETQIPWVTPSLVCQQGDAVTLGALAAGVIPEQGSLHMKPAEGPWEQLLLPKVEDQLFSYRFQEVYQSFRFYVRLGDARTDEHEVLVVPPPRIVATAVTLELPQYAGGGTKQLDYLNLEVPQGTTVTWTLTCDMPLASAEMILEDTVPRTMDLADGGRVASLTMRPGESFSYRFRWTEDAHGYIFEEDVRYYVQIVPDSEPQVEIAKPAEDAKATVNKTLTVLYLARDDYGLGDAWIVYWLKDQEEHKVPLGRLDPQLDEHKAVRKLRDDIQGLQVGHELHYTIEVSDNHDGDEGPHLARAQVRRLFIVSQEEYLEYIRELRKKRLAEIRGMHEQELEASTKVDTLQKDAPQPPE
jgi:hypothetical protein